MIVDGSFDTGELVMVDDNEAEIMLAYSCFEQSQRAQRWVSFTDPQAFLTYMEEVKTGARAMPRVVLLDINLVVMTGFEVLEKIRADPHFCERPPFIMLTNSGQARDRQRARAAGADEYCQKPDNLDDYVEFFRQLPI